MAFTSYMEQTVLKLFFNGVPYTAPTSYSMGLSFTDPTSSITEPTAGTGYARITVTNDTTSTGFNTPIVDSTNGGYKVTNKGTLAFPTANGSWTNGAQTSLAYSFIVDASNNLIASGSLQTPKTVTNGDTPQFGAGTISLTLV